MTMKSAPSSFRRMSKAALAAVALVLAMHGPCRADYPEKPIRLLLPFPAGGAVDFVARLVSARMADELGRPFVIENKAGAGGIIATDATAKAAPDGYTLLLTTPNHTINAALNPKLPYDTEKDLVPVSIWAEVPELLVSHPAAPFDSLCRLCRLRQEESRQAQLRVRRQRHASACDHGIAAAADRHRGRPHPLSRRGAGHDRSAGRPGAAQDGHLRHRQPARRRRQAPCARLCEPRALDTDAERADGGRDGACRIRGHPVDRHDGAGGNATADHRQACDRGAARDAMRAIWPSASSATASIRWAARRKRSAR